MDHPNTSLEQAQNPHIVINNFSKFMESSVALADSVDAAFDAIIDKNFSVAGFTFSQNLLAKSDGIRVPNFVSLVKPDHKVELPGFLYLMSRSPYKGNIVSFFYRSIGNDAYELIEITDMEHSTLLVTAICRDPGSTIAASIDCSSARENFTDFKAMALLAKYHFYREIAINGVVA